MPNPPLSKEPVITDQYRLAKNGFPLTAEYIKTLTPVPSNRRFKKGETGVFKVYRKPVYENHRAVFNFNRSHAKYLNVWREFEVMTSSYA